MRRLRWMRKHFRSCSKMSGTKLQALNAELDAVNKEIPTARAKERPGLQSQRDTVQGQIALAQALQNNLQQLTSFVNSTDAANGVATELTAKIRALQRTVPTAAIPAGSTSGQDGAETCRRAAANPISNFRQCAQRRAWWGRLDR